MQTRIYLLQHANPRFQGDEHTPDEPRHVYKVTKVVNAIDPPIGATLTRSQVYEYTHDEQERYTVTIT